MAGMNIEMALRSALVSLSQVHVLATDSKNMSNAMDLILQSIKAIETARKESEAHDDHNGQGENV